MINGEIGGKLILELSNNKTVKLVWLFNLVID